MWCRRSPAERSTRRALRGSCAIWRAGLTRAGRGTTRSPCSSRLTSRSRISRQPLPWTEAMRLPLWQALTGTAAPGRGVAHVYASGGLYRDGATTEDLAREATSYVASGFTTIKMKIGALPLADDLARVRAVRDAVGPDIELWVDAVNQLPTQDALAWCRALADLGVRAIQAPVAFDDVTGMARINRYGLPVIAAETEFRPARFEALLQAGAVGWLQYCLGLCGGLTGATRLDAMAAARHIPSSPQCFST